MKSSIWIWVPLAALLGVAAGSWGPRQDLRRVRVAAEHPAAGRRGFAPADLGAFTRLANIPDRASSLRSLTNSAAAVAADAPAATNAPAVPPRRLTREDLRARIAEAAELWNTRVEMAKVEWRSILDLNGEAEAAAFDAALTVMNESLRASVEEFAAAVEEAGTLTPELGLRLTGDVSTTLVEAYEAIGQIVGDERRATVSKLPVYEFIDPMVAEPMIGVEAELSGGGEAMWLRSR